MNNIRLHDASITNCRDLENVLHRERIKTKALQDELCHPINIHRWRALQYQDPIRYDKICKVQKLQRRIIETADEIGDLDRLVGEKEKFYCEIRASLDRRPTIVDVKQKLEQYRLQMNSKLDQIKVITIEIETQRRKVHETKLMMAISSEDDRRQTNASRFQSVAKTSATAFSSPTQTAKE